MSSPNPEIESKKTRRTSYLGCVFLVMALIASYWVVHDKGLRISNSNDSSQNLKSNSGRSDDDAQSLSNASSVSDRLIQKIKTNETGPADIISALLQLDSSGAQENQEVTNVSSLFFESVPVVSSIPDYKLEEFDLVEKYVIQGLDNSFKESIAQVVNDEQATSDERADFHSRSVEAYDEQLQLLLGCETFDKLSTIGLQSHYRNMRTNPDTALPSPSPQ